MPDVSESLRAAVTGRYEVDREIGQGGMAIVFRVRDVRHERWVALKVLRPDLSSSLGGERFLREIRVAANLQHPHILPVHDSGEAGGLLFYVMPYVEGESLRERMEREGALPLDDALRLAREVAGALHYAHERDIVHRDIKPENILLSGGHALVADFGLARAISAAGGLKLTETGLAVGTPTYMSPEQASAEGRIDARADVYALGCVLYEMLAGEAPYRGPTAHTVMAQHSIADIPSVRRLRSGVPEPVDLAIQKALAKNPADRFPTAAAFAAALPFNTAAHASPPRKLSVLARSAVAIAAVGVLLGAAWVGRSTWAAGREAEPISIAVAPVRNLGDTSDAYFADGMTQELSNALARVRGIAPRPYASVAALSASAHDPMAIGRKLQVQYVLASTLRRSGEQIRMSTELIRVRDGTNVWSPRSFQGSDANLILMQDSITSQITRELAGNLIPATPTVASTGRGRRDPEAYKLYLQGKQQRIVSAEGSRRAVELFSQAVGRDSTFADAWLGLSSALGSWSQYSGEAPSDLTRRRVEALNRALALDSLNGDSWTQRGDLTAYLEWDIEKATKQHERAIELAPASAGAYTAYAQHLFAQLNLPDSAMTVLDRAIQLDPTNAHTAMLRGYFLQAAGRLEDAEAALRHTLQLDSGSWTGYTMLGKIAQKRGRFDEAVRFLEEAHRLQGPDDPFSLSFLGYFYGITGRREQAEAVLDRLTEMSRRKYVERAWFSIARHGLGDRAGVLTELEASANAREPDFVLAIGRAAADFWNEPRYRALLDRSGLRQFWRKPPAR